MKTILQFVVTRRLKLCNNNCTHIEQFSQVEWEKESRWAIVKLSSYWKRVRKRDKESALCCRVDTDTRALLNVLVPVTTPSPPSSFALTMSSRAPNKVQKMPLHTHTHIQMTNSDALLCFKLSAAGDDGQKPTRRSCSSRNQSSSTRSSSRSRSSSSSQLTSS